MKQIIVGTVKLLCILVCLSACCKRVDTTDIIPKPNQVEAGRGVFVFREGTKVYTNLEGSERDNMLAYLKSYAPELSTADEADTEQSLNLLIVGDSSELPTPESYLMDVSPKRITIRATGGAGIFYGVQSLLQSIDADSQVAAMVIKDSPRFPYRGLHLDVSRHFLDKEFVKKQLDMMAYYKLNRFHWHLTDGAGWRIEIKKYPKLTEIAAWRPYKTWKEWWRADRHYCTKDDPAAYGGYYTQEEIKEVVAYAAERYITVIPEIEMPGHSEEVLAVYPELSCSGKPYVNSDFCIGNEQTFAFLEDVLTEVMALFPSKYIHIGGDEAGKGGWKTCPKCKARMKAEGLKDVDELQSYMIHRIEKFLNDNGRDLLGWDEILEGGLAPNATVMSWRGEEGGLAAVNSGHRAIMSPGGYCYLDGYQDAPPTQPEAIGGYLPLKKVYSYDPVPASLDAGKRDLILGPQANVWAEYIPTPEQMEYMIYPRLLALAEVAWTNPENKDYDDFHRRALKAVSFLQSRGYHPFDLSKEIGERKESLQPVANLAQGKKVIYNTPYAPQYTAGGDTTLVDGLKGGWTYGDRRWQGFLNADFDVVVDMGAVIPIHSVTATFMQCVGPYVWLPKEVVISVSDDNKEYREIKRIVNTISDKEEGLLFEDFGWEGDAEARYIRYRALSNGIDGGWLFTDEIVVQ